MKLVLLPTIANPGSRPKQLFGFRENEGNDQWLPHGLKATKRVNDLLPSLAPIASVYSAIGKAQTHFLTCMGLTYKRVGQPSGFKINNNIAFDDRPTRYRGVVLTSSKLGPRTVEAKLRMGICRGGPPWPPHVLD